MYARACYFHYESSFLPLIHTVQYLVDWVDLNPTLPLTMKSAQT